MITAEVHLYDDVSGIDFVEECLDAKWEYREL